MNKLVQVKEGLEGRFPEITIEYTRAASDWARDRLSVRLGG